MFEAPDNESTTSSILAPNQRLALDWSLVLTSQGIESTLVRSDEDGQWRLLVDKAEEPKALAAISLYQAENRGWRWRRELPWSGLTFHWGALPWCLGLILFHALQAVRGVPLQSTGWMDNEAVRHGQWWRLFTAITLHADVGHLVSNVSFGLVLLGLAMARFGAGWGLLAAYGSGAAGNLAGLIFSGPDHRSLGASGMVMGALGLTTVQSLILWRQSPRAGRLVMSALLAGTMLFTLLGLNPDTDVVAHVGGFVSGLLFGAGLAWWPPAVRDGPWPNAIALAALVATVVLTWWLALAR